MTPELAWSLLILSFAILLHGLTTPSDAVGLRRLIYFPICAVIQLYVAFIGAYWPAAPHNRIRLSCAALIAFMRATELLLCSQDPRKDYVFLGPTEPGSALWATRLVFSLRGSGWNWRVRGTPQTPPVSVWAFVQSVLARWAVSYFTMELFLHFMRAEGGRWAGEAMPAIAHCAFVYASVEVLNGVVCLLWVAFMGKTGMLECPPLFGSIRDMGTVRDFWGKGWHQSFRRSFTVIPGKLLEIFGRQPRWMGFPAFLISGIYHGALSYTATEGAYYFNTFLFFAIQPLAITFEEHVLRVRERARWVGYAWVLLWMLITSGLFFSDWVKGGVYSHPAASIEVEVFSGLIRRVAKWIELHRVVT